jgi:CheY-like chemotaxis protein
LRLEGLKILVVDDASDNQVLVSRFLNLAGATVETANNGIEGMEMALKGDYDLVLMDIQMPQLDGYGATKALRRKGFDKPIIALTAHAMREERDRCLMAGCNDHITKPINRLILLERIASHTCRNSVVSD